MHHACKWLLFYYGLSVLPDYHLSRIHSWSLSHPGIRLPADYLRHHKRSWHPFSNRLSLWWFFQVHRIRSCSCLSDPSWIPVPRHCYMRRSRPFRMSRLLRPDKISPTGHSVCRNHTWFSCRLPVYVRSVCLFHHSRISPFFLPDLWWMSGCLLSHKYNSLSYLLHWWRSPGYPCCRNHKLLHRQGHQLLWSGCHSCHIPDGSLIRSYL